MLDLHSILSDVTKWLSFELIYFFFFADFSPKFIRTKRSYLQLVGNTSSSSQNSISSLPGMKKDKQRCMHVNPCFGNFLRNEVHYDQNFKANAYIFFGLLQFSPLIVAAEFYPMTQYPVIVFCIRTQLNGKTIKKNLMKWLKSTEKCWRILG